MNFPPRTPDHAAGVLENAFLATTCPLSQFLCTHAGSTNSDALMAQLVEVRIQGHFLSPVASPDESLG